MGGGAKCPPCPPLRTPMLFYMRKMYGFSETSGLTKYFLLVRYSFILGSQNVDFLATWAEIANYHKSKQDFFHRGDLMYHRFQ